LKAENIKKINIWTKDGKLMKTKNALFIIQEWSEWSENEKNLLVFMNNLNEKNLSILIFDSLNKGGFLSNPNEEFIASIYNIINLKILKSKLKRIDTSNMDEDHEFLIKEVIENLNDLLTQDVDAWYNLGLNFKKLQKYNEALEAFDQVLEIEPNNVGALHNKGVIFEVLGKNQEALKFYYLALDIDPNYHKALLSIGKLLQKIGNDEEAIEYLDKLNNISSKTMLQ
jgi:tetratricopeptide (TPR) repeat protein